MGKLKVHAGEEAARVAPAGLGTARGRVRPIFGGTIKTGRAETYTS